MSSYNSEFKDVLLKLSSIMKNKGETFRASAYKKAYNTINSIDTPIKDFSELKGKPNIGNSILNKLKEYQNKGTLDIIQNENNSPMLAFTQIYGVGAKKAKELIEKNKITTIEELKQNTHLLNDVQKKGIKYYDDILKRIPRSEIQLYEKKFQNIFNNLNTYIINNGNFEIVGSYRRKKDTSGDIDVIITADKNETQVYHDCINALISSKIIIETLSYGDIKGLFISKLDNKPARRLDFMCTNKIEYPFSLLYFTGSGNFNTEMRKQALIQGYTLNEHGIRKYMKKSQPPIELEYDIKTENDIFDYLNLKYIEPQDRISGQSIIHTQSGGNKTKYKKLYEFKENGIGYLKSLKKKDIEKMYRDALHTYYNEEPIISDSLFDILKEYIEKIYPKSSVLKIIGAPLKFEKEKVKLPYFMGSMNKIKHETNALNKWKSKFKGSYVLSAKLDGISALYVIKNGNPKLYTRGDGEYGQDITYLLPYLNLYNNKKYENTVIRGELIMNKKVFEEKYSKSASNARNLVAGIVNSKKSATEDKFKDIEFVAYEIITPLLKPKKQFELMKEIKDTTKKLNVVKNTYLENVSKLTNDEISKILQNWRNTYKYEIDGVIITQDKLYKNRKKGNPEHSVAFKMILTEQTMEATVLDVIWTPSKDGYLKPRIKITPVNIGGAKIEYATAFNAKYVVDNNIAPGTVISLIRSGDVIPHINKVLKMSDKPKMPEIDYNWTDSNVDIIMANKDENSIVKEKNITGFFTGLNTTGLSKGTVNILINSGYNSIKSILNIKKEDLLKLDGFKERRAMKIYEAIQDAINNADIIDILSSANIFERGFGKKKIKLLFNTYPNILDKIINGEKKKPVELIMIISQLDAFGRKTASSFVKNIDKAKKFINDIGLMYKYDEFIENNSSSDNNSEKSISNKLDNVRVVITGFRSKELEQLIENNGGSIGTSISRKVNYLIVKDLDENTTKANKAKKLGIPLILEDVFIKNFELDG